MQVDIYIREINGNREIRIPWLPEEIKHSTGEASMATYEIINKGEVAIPTGVGLATFAWSSLFPGEKTDRSMLRGSWKKPSTYHDILESWKTNGTKLNLLVTGYPINKNVYITEYTATDGGAFGDISYSVTFTEARSVFITSQTVKQTSADTGKRSAPKKATAYVVKTGDTLWSIAEQFLGSGSKWKTIYDQNKTIIETTAKKRWKAAGFTSTAKDSENGHWIFPGTKLLITTEAIK